VLTAERSFRRVKGCGNLARLVVVLPINAEE
jgi:hypothetical protein